MPSVAFVTYQASPLMTDDDRLAAEELGQAGVTVSSVVWDSAGVNWPSFDCVVIRSAWDYHLKPGGYRKWIRGFEPDRRRLWNPPAAVLENMNKRYLTVLAAKGVNVVPTRYLAAPGEPRLQALLEECGWDEAVVKPAVSASALGTWRTSLTTASVDQARFAEQASDQDTLVQPYLPEIAAPGEWSLVFFGGQYSHAVLKKPAPGDFRVQRHHGGHATAAEPDPALVDQAEAILRAIGHEFLYARLDGIDRGGRFMLMEAEVNEPYLFIGLSKGAAGRFAEAIIRVVPGSRQPLEAEERSYRHHAHRHAPPRRHRGDDPGYRDVGRRRDASRAARREAARARQSCSLAQARPPEVGSGAPPVRDPIHQIPVVPGTSASYSRARSGGGERAGPSHHWVALVRGGV